MKNLKKKLKESKSVIIVMVIVAVSVYWAFDETNVMFSTQAQYDYMIRLYSTIDLKCEIVTGVPENYYSGKIVKTYPIRDSSFLSSPFMFGVNLDEQQVTEIQEVQLERFSKLPCYDKWILLNINDLERFGLI